MKLLQEVYAKVGILIVVLTAALATNYLFAAWSSPPADPPNSNVDAPVNIGTTRQDKEAPLGVEGLAVFGGALIMDGTQATGSVLMSQDGLGTTEWVATSSLGLGGGSATDVTFSSLFHAEAPNSGPSVVTTTIGPSADWDACYLTHVSAYGGNADNEDEDFSCLVFDTGSEWQLEATVVPGEGVDTNCRAQCFKVAVGDGGGGGGGGGGDSLPSCNDGDTLVYNEPTGSWECSAGGGGGGLVVIDSGNIGVSGSQTFEESSNWTAIHFNGHYNTGDDTGVGGYVRRDGSGNPVVTAFAQSDQLELTVTSTTNTCVVRGLCFRLDGAGDFVIDLSEDNNVWVTYVEVR